MSTPRIIAFTKDWHDVPTCTTHILREMGRRMPVLWVNSIGTRKPSLASGRDLGRILMRLRRLFARAEWKENQLRVLSPLLMPKAESTLMRWLNRKLFAWYVRRERDWMGDGPIEYWCFVPNAVDLVERGVGSAERRAPSAESRLRRTMPGQAGSSTCHGEVLWTKPGARLATAKSFGQSREHDARRATLVYYCVDDWSEFEDLDSAWIAGRERALLQRADVVFATSRYLADRCAQSTKAPVHYMPHGVDHAKFARAIGIRSAERGAWSAEHGARSAAANAAAGERQAPSTETTIGFYGNLCPWIDFVLVAELAKARPDWHFVLIGPINADIAMLASLPNVELPGRVEHDDLPTWCARFDAAMIPYDMRHPRMKSVNPVKARELLAAGVPLVASRLPDLEGMEPDVAIADSVDEWLAALERQSRRADRADISARVADQNWSGKVAAMRKIVHAAK